MSLSVSAGNSRARSLPNRRCLYFLPVGAFVARLGMPVLLLFALHPSVSMIKSVFEITISSCMALVAMKELSVVPQRMCPNRPIFVLSQ